MQTFVSIVWFPSVVSDNLALTQPDLLTTPPLPLHSHCTPKHPLRQIFLGFVDLMVRTASDSLARKVSEHGLRVIVWHLFHVVIPVIAVQHTGTALLF